MGFRSTRVKNVRFLIVFAGHNATVLPLPRGLFHNGSCRYRVDSFEDIFNGNFSNLFGLNAHSRPLKFRPLPRAGRRLLKQF